MKIEYGQIFDFPSKPKTAIKFECMNALPLIEVEQGKGFSYFDLNKNQMKKLIKYMQLHINDY